MSFLETSSVQERAKSSVSVREGLRKLTRGRRLSLFEKVICINALVLVGEAIVGVWVTSHLLERYHYLIDTGFIVLATVISVLVNILLLRASFRPLFSLLQTIRLVSAGKTEARAPDLPTDTEIGELAQGFNSMLDRLESMRRVHALLIWQAQEEERRRVALELHDESSQNLTALLVHIEILQQTFQGLPATSINPTVQAQLATGLEQLALLAQQTLESIRSLALQLRPSVLDDLGLYAALRWLAEDCRQRLRVDIDLLLPPPEKQTTYPQMYETTLFRVAQEGLTNATRHGRASKVTLTLDQDEKSIRLRVHDDGQGYEIGKQRSGLGIVGMRERVTLLGGKLDLLSAPGQGTTISATLPLPDEARKGEEDA